MMHKQHTNINNQPQPTNIQLEPTTSRRRYTNSPLTLRPPAITLQVTIRPEASSHLINTDTSRGGRGEGWGGRGEATADADG